MKLSRSTLFPAGMGVLLATGFLAVLLTPAPAPDSRPVDPSDPQYMAPYGMVQREQGPDRPEAGSPEGRLKGGAAGPAAKGTKGLKGVKGVKGTKGVKGAKGAKKGPRKRPTLERNPDNSRRWIVRFFLIPFTLGMLGLLGWGIWRARKTPGLPLAVGVSLLLGAAAIWPVLSSPTGQVLQRDVEFRDSVDSVEVVAGVRESLPRLTDVTRRHSFPEGATWLAGGPAWLAYLPAAFIAIFTGPVGGHNLGLGLHVAMLALAAWALGRALGLGPILALLAASGAAMAPKILAEMDACSLDRATFYLIPLFFLCLHKTTLERGRLWPILGGVCLGAVFLGQTYYGLYLAAVCPLLVIPRIIGKGFKQRLSRLALLAVVGAAVLLPGVIALDRSTRGTVYQRHGGSFSETFPDLLQPMDFEQAYHEIQGYGEGRFHMANPRDRLLTTLANSSTMHDVLAPSDSISGNSLYWGLVVLAVFLARPRRRPLVLIATWDVFVLLLFAMGPFLQTPRTIMEIPLPYYGYMLAIPGFDGLKNVWRFLVMAATISTIPLALGLQGLLQRLELKKGWKVSPWGRGIIVAVATFSLCFFHVPLMEKEPEPGDPAAANWKPPPVLTYPYPRTVKYLFPQALAKIEPGQGAVALPIRHPLTMRVRMAAVRADLHLVNQPSFGTPPRTKLPVWYDGNPFLNRLAHISGSRRAGRELPYTDRAKSFAELKKYGLRYVVVFRDEMDREKLKATELFLDKETKKVADDGVVAVWEIGS